MVAISSIDGTSQVGHFDLTNFLGIPGDFSSSIYLDAIKRIVVGKKNNKSLGIMINNKDELELYTIGFNMIAVNRNEFLTRSISEIIS